MAVAGNMGAMMSFVPTEEQQVKLFGTFSTVVFHS